MNTDKILAVADAIENHSIDWLGFNMGAWWDTYGDGNDDRSGHHCKTVACIAGWTVAVEAEIQNKKPEEILGDNTYQYIARKILGLNKEQGVDLFCSFHILSTEDAVLALRHLASTGNINRQHP